MMKHVNDKPSARVVRVGDIAIGQGQALALIAGPCVIESREMCLRAAGRLNEIAADAGLPLIFKASYDKANRTSIRSFRGPGLERGLDILREVRERTGVPVLSDVHTPEQASVAAQVLDVLQVPAFLCRQTDLLVAAAETGKPLNIKKGQFMAPWDMAHVVDKVRSTGNVNCLLTERGTCFGYNNLVSDMRAIPVMQRLGCPVVFDATHSTQLPGAQGAASGGDREMAVPLALAAVAAGCDALFIETHEDPDSARSDAATMLPFDRLPSLLRMAKRIHDLLAEQPT